MDKAFDVSPLLFKNLETVELLLREKKALREELVNFFRSLDEIWQRLPRELESAQRLALLEEVIKKYVTETWQNCSFLEAQVTVELQVSALRARQETERRQEEEIAARLHEELTTDCGNRINSLCLMAIQKLEKAKTECRNIEEKWKLKKEEKPPKQKTLRAIDEAIEVLKRGAEAVAEE